MEELEEGGSPESGDAGTDDDASLPRIMDGGGAANDFISDMVMLDGLLTAGAEADMGLPPSPREPGAEDCGDALVGVDSAPGEARFAARGEKVNDDEAAAPLAEACGEVFTDEAAEVDDAVPSGAERLSDCSSLRAKL